ncbi:MAG: hypothetical protein WD652_00125 [Acidimicrobiia bacterium]
MQPQHRPPPTTLAFHASRIVIDVGVLLAMASLSFAFVTSPSGDRTALQADALPAVVLLLPIFLITLLPDHTRPLPRPLSWASLVLGLAAFPYAIVKHLDASVLADTLGGSVGIGARLLVFGTFVTLVGIGVGLTRTFLGLPTGADPSRLHSAQTARSRPAAAEKAAAALPARAETERGADPPRPASADPSPAPPSPSRTPQRREPEVSPFGEPLFDSLEIPAFLESVDTDDDGTLIFDAQPASDRAADDDADRHRED